MRITWSRRWIPKHSIRFEGKSETTADPPRSRWRRRGVCPRDPMVFDCPRSRGPRALDHCVRCEYFVNFKPVPNRRQVLMVCRCSDGDPILRSSDTRRTWPTVDPDAPLAHASRLVRLHRVPLVLVVHKGKYLGVVYREDLDESEVAVGTRVTSYPWALPESATLGDAVEALRASGAPALLVLRPDGQLAGVVSLEYLEHLGVPGELLR